MSGALHWQAPVSRPTMDIDLLGRTDNAMDAIVTKPGEAHGSASSLSEVVEELYKFFATILSQF
jgi:hypothetical protein